MLPMLFQTVSNACAFGGLNANNWVGICAAVIMVSLMVASLFYIFAGMIPKKEGDKIRGYVRFEYIQAILSGVIIVMLLALAAVTCNISAGLTTPSQDSFSFAQHWVGNLLFVKGIALETSMYSTGIQFGMWSGVISGGVTEVFKYLPQLSTQRTIGPFTIAFKPPSDFGVVFENYASVIIDFFIPILIVSFAMLLIQFITLPVISAVSLTVVLPVALIMRSLSFTGPRLREAANSFIAVAVAFYFVYPMTFVMDNSIVNWMYCTQTPGSTCIGNPYPQYLAPYMLNNIQPSTLFSSTTATTGAPVIGLPISFYQTALTQLCCNFLSPSFNNPFSLVFYAPAMVTNLAQELAQYLFEATVLMALNLAVTIGLAYGLWKGLTGGLSFLGGEGFF